MPLVALVLILAGVLLTQSSAVNRNPWQAFRDIMRSPERAGEIWAESAGEWDKVVKSPKGDDDDDGKTPKGENGKLPASALTALSWARNQRLANRAAGAAERLNVAFVARFGRNLSVTDSYRTYEEQVAIKALKGNLAAEPGTSNHGWGTALDLGGGINRFSTPEYKWMIANAPTHGWNAPSWARQNGSKPEPWHWEYVG